MRNANVTGYKCMRCLCEYSNLFSGSVPVIQPNAQANDQSLSWARSIRFPIPHPPYKYWTWSVVAYINKTLSLLEFTVIVFISI